MERVEAVVVGAGHAGLATSHELTRLGIEHVVVEAGSVAGRWRDRWDTFCLLTPNWATWLPGWHYTGPDPHGFMVRDEIVQYLEGYARSFDAPVREHTPVRSLEPEGSGGYRLDVGGDRLLARSVVVATGPFQQPRRPAWAPDLSSDVRQLHSSEYRRAADLPPGRVLVVGAGPSGQQIAEDLLRAGREVSIAVGSHRRVPRRYRGRDYYWWLELGGFYEKTVDDADPRMRAHPVAPVLTGYAGGHDLDLRELAAHGATLLGRAVGGRGTVIELDDGLSAALARGDAAYGDFVSWVESRLHRFDGLFDDVTPRSVHPDPPPAPATLDLARANVTSIVWATGFQSSLRPWMNVPVLDDAGRPQHQRGVTAAPGLYVIGRSWLHRLRSAFIRGAEEDARYVTTRLQAQLR